MGWAWRWQQIGISLSGLCSYCQDATHKLGSTDFKLGHLCKELPPTWARGSQSPLVEGVSADWGLWRLQYSPSPLAIYNPKRKTLESSSRHGCAVTTMLRTIRKRCQELVPLWLPKQQHTRKLHNLCSEMPAVYQVCWSITIHVLIGPYIPQTCIINGGILHINEELLHRVVKGILQPDILMPNDLDLKDCRAKCCFQ